MQRNSYEARRIAELVEAGARVVKQHRCPKCGVECLRGDDHDDCAMRVTVDIEPIDRLAETLALLNHLATFDICRQTGKTARPGAFVLYYREPWHYENAERAYPVLVQHQCRKAA